MSKETAAVKSTNRWYLIRFLGAMITYAVVLAIVVSVLNADYVTGPARYAIALIPMLPVLAVPAAVLGLLRRIDELQRQMHLESLAIAFAVGSVLTFGYGFLQLVGAPELNWFMVWPVYAFSWLGATLVVNRRYAADGE